MDKLQKIKDDYCPYDANYNLFPSEIEWMIEQIEELEKENESLGKTLREVNTYYVEVDGKLTQYENALKEIDEYGGTDMIGKTCAKVAREALREIDTHIRSTSDPVPYIVKTLKKSLPEYE